MHLMIILTFHMFEVGVCDNADIVTTEASHLGQYSKTESEPLERCRVDGVHMLRNQTEKL